jgi:Haem-dependent oxidative N-demethylase, alpha subunit-like
MSFDFDAAVSAPFRMQPGLRRLAAGSPQLTPLQPGSRHQREKLAVLSAFWTQALRVRPGFDAGPALAALCTHAAGEHPDAWAWDGRRALALRLATAVDVDGAVEQTARGRFGLGDEVSRCLRGLPAPWRLAGLLSLAFAEDFAVVDGRDGRIPWLAVALPSHWAPEEKVGRHFAEVHAPVADGELLRKAGAALVRLVTGSESWERFVWNVTDQPRLHAHPSRVDRERWQHTAVADAWWRTERQTFLPLAPQRQAVFTIHVDVRRLADAIDTPARAAALHAAIASMSAAVLGYRGLTAVRAPLLDWLAARS